MAIFERRRLRLKATDYSEDAGEPRSDGAHVAAILWSMEQDMLSALGGKKPGKFTEEMLSDYAWAGFMFEQILARTWSEVEPEVEGEITIRPGEFGWCATCEKVMAGWLMSAHCEKTGHRAIYGTPDGIIVRQDGDELAEYKATWKSEASAVLPKDGEDLENSTEWVEDETIEFGQWRWVMQVKCYCFLLEIRRVTFRTVFMNGNYKPPQPHLWEFRIAFEPGEVEEAWASVAAHARSKDWI